MMVLMASAAAFLQPPVAAAVPPPAARIRRIISGGIVDTDYPVAALQAWVQGTTTAQVELSDDGSAMSCAVTGSSGNAALDERSCASIVHRFKFEPAGGPCEQPQRADRMAAAGRGAAAGAVRNPPA